MKKIFALLLSFVFLFSVLAVFVSADDSADNTVIELDFSKITEIKSITTEKGAKATFQIGDDTGWMSSKSEFVQDDGVQVLKFVKDDGLLHGFDLNTLKDLTEDPVVYSMTFKVIKMEEGSYFQFAMVNQDTNSWFYSFRLTPDGKMKMDTTGNNTSAAGTDGGTLTFNEYHTVSVVYFLSLAKQAYYVDGVPIAEQNGFRQGTVTTAISDCTRFKIETPKSDGAVELYIKKVAVYNAAVPDESAGLSNVKDNAIASLNASVHAEDYKAETLAQVNSVISDYTNRINTAETTDLVASLLAEAKEELAAIEKDSESALLSAAISSAAEELSGYVVVGNYRTDDQATVKALLSEYDAKIRAAETIEAVSATLAEAKAKLDEISPLSPGEVVPIVDMDFSEIEKIGSFTFPNGAKSVFQIGDTTGWLSSKSSFVGEGADRVFNFVRDDNLLHGFDINTLGNFTGDPIVFSMTFSYTKIEGNSVFEVAAIDQTGGGNAWYYTFNLFEGGRLCVDATKRNSQAPWFDSDKVTYIATLTPDVYHTISVVYSLSEKKQEFYVDSELVKTINGFHGNPDAAPTDITRFKIETPAATGDVDINIKSISVYNGSLPIEAVSIEAAAQAAVSAIGKYSDAEKYSEGDFATVQALIREYTEKINMAESSVEIMKLLAEAQEKIDAVPDKEERAVLDSLDAAKERGKAEIRSLVNLSDYSEENQESLRRLIEKSLSDIDLQTDESALERVVKIARNKILAVKTLQQEQEAAVSDSVETSDNTAAPSESGTTDRDNTDPLKNGCKSTVSAGSFATVVLLMFTPLARKKKEK